MGVLADKVALITGGTRGMGLATAKRFGAEGAQVAITARRLAEAEKVVAELGDAALALQLDVTDRTQWDAAIAAVDARWGRLDVLVNCAGITIAAPVEQETVENWRVHMATNLDGAFHGCQAALPLLRRGAAASIVNISSMFAQRPVPGFAAYCASKAALTTFSKVLALECAALDPPIRVNTVHPGGTETDMLEKALADTGLPRDEAYAHFIGIHPMRRMGKAEEVASACLWLASDQSSFTTGSEINVDGGGHIRP